jgi:hypothetical protein
MTHGVAGPPIAHGTVGVSERSFDRSAMRELKAAVLEFVGGECDGED